MLEGHRRHLYHHRRSSKAPGRSTLEDGTTTEDGSSRGGHDPADPVSAVSEPCELGDDAMTCGGSAARSPTYEVRDLPLRLAELASSPQAGSRSGAVVGPLGVFGEGDGSSGLATKAIDGGKWGPPSVGVGLPEPAWVISGPLEGSWR